MEALIIFRGRQNHPGHTCFAVRTPLDALCFGRAPINNESTVVAWFSNHQFPLAKLREITKAKLGKARELVKAGATRFGTHTLVGERLEELKPSLQATVVDPRTRISRYQQLVLVSGSQ